MKSKNVSIGLASLTRVRLYGYVGTTNNPLRFEFIDYLFICTERKLFASDDAFAMSERTVNFYLDTSFTNSLHFLYGTGFGGLRRSEIVPGELLRRM